MIIGSHDSCTLHLQNKALCLCSPWTKTQLHTLEQQFDLGVRLFDVRYQFNKGTFFASHTYDTSYTIQDMFTELITRASAANEYIYIRLKRDYASPPLPAFGKWLTSVTVQNKPLQDYIVYHTGKQWDAFDKTPTQSSCVVLYSDDSTLYDDNVTPEWYFPQLFDTVETWPCGTVKEAVQRIVHPVFANNGLPKAIFIDFSAKYPPDMAFNLVWQHVKPTIQGYIQNNTIQCIMVNSIDESLMQQLRN